MNAHRVYICPTHGQVPNEEIEGVEIFDFKTKELNFVLEHIPGKPKKCFQKVKPIHTEREPDESSLC